MGSEFPLLPDAIAAAAFLYMACCKDTGRSRLFLFAAYTFGMVAHWYNRILYIRESKASLGMARRLCYELNKKVGDDSWSAITKYEDYWDCREQVEEELKRNAKSLLGFVILFQIHFSLVLWSHYKASSLTIKHGGCQPNKVKTEEDYEIEGSSEEEIAK